MDILALLRQAHEAGLKIKAEGDRLVIRGPRAAEPIVRLLVERKPAVMAALASADRWLERYRRALAMFRRLHGDAEAAALAWGDVTAAWHKEHGERAPERQCAGCRQPISGDATLTLADGCRVHIHELDCLIAYGQRWRGAAGRALEALGIPMPADDETAAASRPT